MNCVDENHSTAVGLPEALQPLAFPLHGSRLIEASAGTGKTWTIAALYVRLVLGHGNQAAYVRPLTPPEILVATFTDAASQELRDRIRARLSEAASFFMQPILDYQDTSSAEPFLQELRADYAPELWLGCARKLQLAAEWMDEAAVSTIHGWCSRMLREHAFDSNSLFTLTLEADQTELMTEVVRDYWRTFVINLPAEHATLLRSWWSEPDVLLKEFKSLLAHKERLPMAQTPAIEMEQALSEKKHLLSQLKQSCQEWIDELEVLLQHFISKKLTNGQKLQTGHSSRWLKELRNWINDPDQEQPVLSDTAWDKLSPEGIQDAWKDGTAPAAPVLDACVVLRTVLKRGFPCAKARVLCHASHWVAERFASEQLRHGTIGFDEQITGLNDALQGPNGTRLAATIRQQFPAVLIDEFQDTDPIQYQIFDTVYRLADNDKDLAIVLIGDPKQAIYGFRGADIYTYLAARQAAQGRLYTLQTNYRSTVAMVDAVNRCFELAENRPSGAGAFLFRQNDINPMPFFRVQAQGRDHKFVVDGSEQPALTIWQAHSDQLKINKTDAKEQMASACAGEIARLLGLAQTSQAGFEHTHGFTALTLSDIAVLVNTRSEADEIQAALSRLGVRSVYLSDQSSVFGSPLAADVYYWLMACAEPDDSRHLHAALATSVLGLSWDALDQLNTQENLWELRVLQFRAYRDYWRKQGVLPMLRRLLNDFDVPARLVSTTPNDSHDNGERVLTDILHLAELLQSASGLIKGEHALIRYFIEKVRTATNKENHEAQQMRLESDADLIQIVTVHKSKGLEYPLVFLPFAWRFRPVKSSDVPIKFHTPDGQLQIALSSHTDVLIQADHERLGEDLRKLYVGMTRARYATWLGMAGTEDQHNSAIGYLLGLDAPVSEASVDKVLRDVAGASKNIVVMDAPDEYQQSISVSGTDLLYGPAKLPVRNVREHWWISSYSGLASQRGAIVDFAARDTDSSPATHAEDRFTELLLASDIENDASTESRALLETDTKAQGLLHEFPRGPEPGSFLHDVLEWAAELGFSQLQQNQEALRQTLSRRCAFRGWQDNADSLFAWLLEFTSMRFQLGADVAMQSTGFGLAELSTYSAEMEFLLPAQHVSVSQLDALISAYTLQGIPRPALQTEQLNGMLKGFIDLVFEFQGQYYVADYKSNYLGPDNAFYTPEAMRQVVTANRYDLQYVLYLLALHRLLKVRLHDYDYDRHIGGALCFFLRGLHAPSQGIHAERPERHLIEALDQMFSGTTPRA